MKNTRTGDTIIDKGAKSQAFVLDGLQAPPVFTAAVDVSTGADRDALISALRALETEDPLLRVVYEDDETGQTLVSGMGELHLQILEDRIRRQFRVPSASLGRMRVAYRERPTIVAAGRATHDVTNSSGKRTYAHVELEVEQDADRDAVVIVSNSVLMERVPLLAVMKLPLMYQRAEQCAARRTQAGHRRGNGRGLALDALRRGRRQLSENCIADQDSTPAAFRTAERAARRTGSFEC